MDATKEEDVKKAIEGAVKKWSTPLWGTINCAGIGAATLTVDKKGTPHPSNIFDFVMKVNLFGTFNACKYSAAVMFNNKPDEAGLRGVLINVASVAAIEGQKGQVAYAASKGAVTQMTLPMARDLGQYGIRVMTVCPGIFDTPLLGAASDVVKKSLSESVVAPKRLGMPAEFALLVTQIIENSYFNGEIIRLDGAIRMGYSSKI
jgi:3-hydroxyacyl-CoA dehydrogenase/3-hydroxy-2-methylbutyryl-CoA dehydrogenase